MTFNTKRKRHQQIAGVVFFFLLRGPESNRGLEVMSLPRYLSSTPLCLFLLVSDQTSVSGST